jgi:Tol biopolymer transport system component
VAALDLTTERAASHSEAVKARILTVLALLGVPALVLVHTWQPRPLRLALVARDGSTTTVGTAPPSTFAPRLSPDGRRVTFDAEGSIWVADLSDLASRLRLAGGAYPMWSPDGRRVLFIAGAGDGQQLFWQSADGSGSPEMLIVRARAPESWSTSAEMLTYITLQGGTNYDVWGYSIRDRTSRPLAARPDALEMSSRLSPNGRWLAYESNESGAPEVYLESFPQTGFRTRVTTGGGRRPLWSPDGTEIYFDRGDSRLYVVSVETRPRVAIGTPASLPITGFVQGPARRQYDLAPDGKAFLMLFPQ